MITNEMINYLDDENKDLEKKYMYIKKLDLSYADLYDLREKYRHDDRIYRMLDLFCFHYYSLNSLEAKIDREHRKYKARMKQKRLRFNKRRLDNDD